MAFGLFFSRLFSSVSSGETIGVIRGEVSLGEGHCERGDDWHPGPVKLRSPVTTTTTNDITLLRPTAMKNLILPTCMSA